jgi:hypothetical protein
MVQIRYFLRADPSGSTPFTWPEALPKKGLAHRRTPVIDLSGTRYIFPDIASKISQENAVA